jgi:hypothetical protein
MASGGAPRPKASLDISERRGGDRVGGVTIVASGGFPRSKDMCFDEIESIKNGMASELFCVERGGGGEIVARGGKPRFMVSDFSSATIGGVLPIGAGTGIVVAGENVARAGNPRSMVPLFGPSGIGT